MNTRSGARISDIRTELERRKIEKYSNIIIQAGGNDVGGRREYEAIENDFAEIIQDIHRRTPQTNVFIAEILPRRRLDMTDINKILGKVCELYGAKLIQTTKTFPRVNAEQFLGDNLHLAYIGTRDLLFCYEDYIRILKKDIQKPTRACYNCGETGHITTNCRYNEKNTVLGMRTHGP